MSSFFEPVPEWAPTPSPPLSPTWEAPVWDRPSEGTLPAIVPVGELVASSDEAVVELESLGVYPNGFTINVAILADPRRRDRSVGWLMSLAGGLRPGEPGARMPRIGVRFADGSTAGRTAGGVGGPLEVEKDESGLPIGPLIRWLGGGGGSQGFRCGAWVHPLPPVGPVEVFVLVPAVGGEEARVVIDGAAVREAATHAKVIWR